MPLETSAKSDGVSLNKCLLAGSPLTQNIFDIMLTFSGHRIALIGTLRRRQGYSLFLWIYDIDDIDKAKSEVALRFTLLCSVCH